MLDDPQYVENELDALLERFDASWRGGKVPALDDYLVRGQSREWDAVQLHELLTELVVIDMEYRWRRVAEHRPGRGDAAKHAESTQEKLPPQPRLEDYLARYPELGPWERLSTELIASEYRTRHRWGDRPSHQEYMQRFSQRERPVRQALRRVDARLPRSSQLDGLHIRCPHCHVSINVDDSEVAGRITCPSCDRRFSLIGDAPCDGQSGEVQSIGVFELLQRLGSGSFGTVWKSRDTQLDRIVAVKLPHQGLLDATQREQFLREARAAAQLRHPNIIPVHEVGREGDRLYIVTDFVRGANVADWLAQQRPTPREAAELCVKLADALAHAHHHDVIHRDLKPSNIMLDSDGEPHLMDFGLAKREAGEITMTAEGKIVGTPAYMPPEQARGAAHDADARSDIYSLGVILYELLTGERPFRGSTQMLLYQIMVEDATNPRRLSHSIPRDLETICLKCLEKDRNRRYQTAAELREDLRRFLYGEPVHARPITKAARTWRWCKRNPVVSGLGAGIVVLAMASTAILSFLYYRAETQTQIALGLQDESRKLAAELALDRGLTLCERGQVGRGLLWLAHTLRIAPSDSADLQRIARANLADWRRDLHTVKTLLTHPAIVEAVAFSSDGSRILTGCADGRARLWDTATGEPRVMTAEHGGRVAAVAFSPDGTHILTGSLDHTARLWDARTGEPLGEPLKHENLVLSVAFSPDGSFALTGSMDKSARFWRVDTREAVGEPLKHEQAVTVVAFSPDGSLFLTGCEDGTAHIWDADTKRAIGEPVKHPSWVWAAAFSPDGSCVVTGHHDGTAHLWDLDLRKTTGTPLAHPPAVRAVAFSPDGSRILTGGHDNSARLWNRDSGRQIGPSLEHEGGVLAIAFSPNTNGMLLTGSMDRTARLWSPAPERFPTRSLQQHDMMVTALAFSSDGQAIVTASEDGTALLWNVDSGQASGPPLKHADYVRAVAISPDVSLILTGCENGDAQLWDPATGERVGKPFAHQAGVWATAFSPDGTLAVTGGIDSTARLWEVASRRHVRTLPHSDWVGAVAFSPDGKRMLTGCEDCRARVWSVDTGKLLGKPLMHRGVVRAVAYSRDGSRIVTGCGDHTAWLWDASTHKLVRGPLRHEAEIRAVDLSPDGTTILTGGQDGTARIWDVATGRPVAAPLRHEHAIYAAAFSPDGSRIATGSEDGCVRLWGAPHSAVQGTVDRIVLWTEVITGLELDHGGAVRGLDTESWNQSRQRLYKLGGPPSL